MSKKAIRVSSRILIFLMSLILAPTLYADVTYLYDATGNVVAVIDPSDNTTNLYMASTGNAVGYVDRTTGAVYSYAGRHIGWYSNGVLFDNNGYILAYVEASRPKNITTPLVKKQVVINKGTVVPSVVIPAPQVVTTPPTYVYEVSPTTFGSVFTVEPAK